MGAGPLQHRPAQGGVGPGVEPDIAVQPRKDAVFVAAQGEGALHGVALRVEMDGFLPAEPRLDGALELPGRQGADVLDGHVLLAAEAAAHQHVLHHHPLRLPAEHDGDLPAGVVDALVGAENLHAALVREGHRALRLQKRVLGEGRAEGPRDPVGRGRQRGRGVAPGDVAGLAEVSRAVHLRRVRGHGLGDGGDGLQHLIVDLDLLLGGLQDLLGLGHHQADGVAHAAGHAAHRDHHVPVLLDMAHLVVGHVLRRQHAHHARKRQRRGGVDGQHPRPGVLRTHGGQVQHALHVDVVGIFAVAQHLLPHVHPEGPPAHAVVVALFRVRVDLRLAPQDGPGQPDAVDDLAVAGAAAEVAPDGVANLLLGGIGVFVQQRLARHDHARGAEAALHRPADPEGVDKGLLLEGRKALHRLDAPPIHLPGGHHAGLHRRAVHDDGAGAAGALAAAVLHGMQVQVVPKIAQQGLVLIGFPNHAVDGETIDFSA